MRGFLALICILGLACIEPGVAYGNEEKKQQQAGEKKQQQNRAPPNTGQAPAYHGTVGGANHVNVSTNRSALTGGPTQAGKSTPAGKSMQAGKPTTIARQPGNRADKLKTGLTPTGMSRSAPRNAAINPRTEPTITKTSEHQTLKTPTGLPVAGLRKWNFPTKSRPDLTLTTTPAVSTSYPPQDLFVARRGIPSQLVKLGPMTPVSGTQVVLQTGPGTGHVPPLGNAMPPPGTGPKPFTGPGNSAMPVPGTGPMPTPPPGTGPMTHPAFTGPGTSTMPSHVPGLTGTPSGNPENGTPDVMSTSQPINMANNPPSTAMPTSIPRNVVNEQGTGEKAPPGQFQQNRRIQGSDQWVDSDYEVFRNYRSEWHDRDWWRTHQSRIVYCVGGWYYWNAGYWFPAWGYDPEADYAYDGPIYAYKDWPPDQVTANVQGTLQKQGYYQGESDGLLGSPTNAALADYQRDHSLYTTSTIDRPTSQSLGMK